MVGLSMNLKSMEPEKKREREIKSIVDKME